MEAIEFPEQTLVLAKDQPEYTPLPVHISDDNTKAMTCCMKLSPEELEEMNRTGVLWLTQLTFGQHFHPIRMSTINPFI